MKYLAAAFLLSAAFIIFSPSLLAQVDDVSEVTGLPIPIGAPIIYGQVLIRNIPKGERRPIVFVYLRNSGISMEKVEANEKGYFYFLKNPADGFTLTFEVNGAEIGSTVITAGISNRVRQDVEFDWNALNGSKNDAKGSGTINVRDSYDRNEKAQKDFDDSMALIKQKKNTEALAGFENIVKADPKDHVAWMMIGTLQMSEKHSKEAREAFQKAIQLRPEYFLAHLNLGRLELSEKNFDAAIATLQAAVQEEPASADANHLLGEAYLQAKKGSMAVQYLNKAIELAPIEKADIHLRLAALYNAAGYKDRASAEYAAFLAKVKDYPDRKKLEDYIKQNPPKQ